MAIRPFGRLILGLGLDPRRLATLRNLPRYLRQITEFKQLGGKVTHRYPILSDYEDQAGSARGHYFHQDLLVAGLIHNRRPARHIDIGSRIDGFVAHVASFRAIEIMDIRALGEIGHPNIKFLQADLMRFEESQRAMTDSVSCLHAIEHFGLGRYGDPLAPDGHQKGFSNIVQMLKPGGTLYISFPIGKADEVHFNAHRVFHPRTIFAWLPTIEEGALELERFDYVDDYGDLHRCVDILNTDLDVSYGCGIYTFRKNAPKSER